MLFDLNVSWPTTNYSAKPTQVQLQALYNTITTLHLLGYTHLAINFKLEENVKFPNSPNEINPIDRDSLKAHFNEKFPDLKLFTRLTLVITDPSQCQGLSKVQNKFDIIAVEPTSEKALQATINLDVDIVSFNMATRLPFFLRHKTICNATDKGIHFEICYSPMISGPAGYAITNNSDNVSLSTSASLARKNFFYNVLQLIRASRSRGLLVSSGASHALQARSSMDIMCLLKTCGLDSSRAKKSFTDNPEKALIRGRLRIKSYKQTIVMGNDNSRSDLLYNNDSENSKQTFLEQYKRPLLSSPLHVISKKRKFQ